MTTLNTDEIMKVLPHRYPMLLVDRIVECDDQTRIVGIRNVSAGDQYLAGHFPGSPIMPGVLQVEAMAQTAGILLTRLIKIHRNEDLSGMIPYFLGIDKARFRKVVKPGDQLRIEVTFIKYKANIAKVKAVVTVDGAVVSEAELLMMVTHEKADGT